MELGDHSSDHTHRSQLDAALDNLNTNLSQLIETVESGALEQLDNADKLRWWQRFETFRNQPPLIDHQLIATAEASDLAGSYGFTNMGRFLDPDPATLPRRGGFPGPSRRRRRAPHLHARGTPGTGVAEAGRAAT